MITPFLIGRGLLRIFHIFVRHYTSSLRINVTIMDEAAKQARRDYQKRWREANREKTRAREREWNKANPDKLRARDERYWQKKAIQTAGQAYETAGRMDETAAQAQPICGNCGKSFIGKRSDAKFCSTRCRVGHSRNK